MLTAHVNGIDLAYHEQGDGEPVLCIHGALLVDNFTPFDGCDELADYRQIRYHRRDLGSSGRSPMLPTVVDHAADARGLLDELGIASAHVVGHSLGGTIALQLAIETPERVRSLALLEGGLVADLPAAANLIAASMPIVEAHTAGDRERAADMFLATVLGEDYRRSFDAHLPAGAFEQAVRDVGVLIERELPAAASHHFDLDDLARLAVPVLLVLGAESDAAAGELIGAPLFAQNHEALLATLPAAAQVVVPGLTHLLQIQSPGPVAAAVAGFIGATRTVAS